MQLLNKLLFLYFYIILLHFIPKSLSYNLIVSMLLFFNIIAAMHFAPFIPNEFFFAQPSKTPKSMDFID